ncbi:39S ribosomal protein L41, mitochondrial [Sergentomyia squamirostris]
MLQKVCPVIFRASRSFHTSPTTLGSKNFRKFPMYNKRGSRIYKQQRMQGLPFVLPIHKYGLRDTGYTDSENVFHEISEMIPELIVPDLKDCQLKPYVSYRAQDVVQSEFTSQDLFNAVYSKKIIEDYKNRQLNADGSAQEPSPEELQTAEEAFKAARKTGSDIF